jgi:hypothetical protein
MEEYKRNEGIDSGKSAEQIKREIADELKDAGMRGYNFHDDLEEGDRRRIINASLPKGDLSGSQEILKEIRQDGMTPEMSTPPKQESRPIPPSGEMSEITPADLEGINKKIETEVSDLKNCLGVLTSFVATEKVVETPEKFRFSFIDKEGWPESLKDFSASLLDTADTLGGIFTDEIDEDGVKVTTETAKFETLIALIKERLAEDEEGLNIKKNPKK